MWIHSENTYVTGQEHTVQEYDSVICRYFCIGFIDFVFKGKILTEFTNYFLPNDFQKNDDIILKVFCKQRLKCLNVFLKSNV